MEVQKMQAILDMNGLEGDRQLAEKLTAYLRLLGEWNERMDLTAVTEEAETVDRHLMDSLAPLKTGLIPKDGKLIDVGTGAGFPGLALAMACPGLQVTLLDAQQKRIAFLEAVCRATGTENVRTVHLRAEDGARKPEYREQFDLAAARAVAPLPVLCEYLLPYVCVGGMALCWKGPAVLQEMEMGKRAAFLLGGKPDQPVPYQIAGREWEHLLLPLRKTGHTPKMYPRKAGTPKARPLGSSGKDGET